jgi:hypothetical protein
MSNILQSAAGMSYCAWWATRTGLIIWIRRSMTPSIPNAISVVRSVWTDSIQVINIDERCIFGRVLLNIGTLLGTNRTVFLAHFDGKLISAYVFDIGVLRFATGGWYASICNQTIEISPSGLIFDGRLTSRLVLLHSDRNRFSNRPLFHSTQIVRRRGGHLLYICFL